MAYLKAHYREEFYTCLLDSESGSKDKVKYYIYELRKHGISVESPNINLSTTRFTINSSSIIYPLSGIRGITINAVNSILEERKKGLLKKNPLYGFFFRFFFDCFSLLS